MFYRNTIVAAVIGLIIWVSNAVADPVPATDKDVDDPIKRMDKPNAAPIVAELKRQAKIEQFRRGSMRSIVFHELGHFLIAEYEIPIGGREEDAADGFVVFALTEKSDPNEMLAPISLWIAMAKDRTRIDWWDSHGTDEQRAARLACLLAGQDRDRYGRLRQMLSVPENKLEECRREAEKNMKSWDTLLAGTGHPFKQFRQEAKVVYEPLSDRDQALEAERSWLMRSQIIEDVARTISTYRLPKARFQRRSEAQSAETDGSARTDPYQTKLAAAKDPHVEIRAGACGTPIAFFLNDIPWRPYSPSLMATLPRVTLPQDDQDYPTCAYRRRRPPIPTHGDHLFRSMTTRWRGCVGAPLDASADLSVGGSRQAQMSGGSPSP
jgi:Putative metallopeptidase